MMKKKFRGSASNSREIPEAVVGDFDLPEQFKHKKMSDTDINAVKDMVDKFRSSGAIDGEVNNYAFEDERSVEKIVKESFDNSVNESNLTPDKYDAKAFEELKRYSASRDSGDNPYSDIDLFDINN